MIPSVASRVAWAILIAMLATACSTNSGTTGDCQTSPASCSGTGGAGDTQVDAAAGESGLAVGRSCNEPAAAPAMVASGQLCDARAVDYRAPPNSTILFSRKSLVDDPKQITAIRISDSSSLDNPNLPQYFDDHDLLLSVTLLTGPSLAAGSGTFMVQQAAFWACGVGSVLFDAPAGATIDFQALDGTASGHVSGTIRGFKTKAFDARLGSTTAAACDGGDVTITIDGPYVFSPG